MDVLIKTTNILYKCLHQPDFEDTVQRIKSGNVDKERTTIEVGLKENEPESILKEGNTTQKHTETIFKVQDNMVGYLDRRRSEPTGRIQRRVRRVAPSSSTVAFHTKMSSAKTLVNGVIMIFDNEILDQGNGYNPRDGIYTVPESGTYVLTWKVLSEKNSYIVTALVVNGEEMGISLTNSEDITDKHQTTEIVVLRLDQGDHVFIRVKTKAGSVVSDTTYGKLTFSGWKI
ncbi:uncharacterized protein LOC117344205 [Pecten maximus]|uniref:uncharacterized protein LOC117344205 n=1 Tax=Pecten maximus TaxID=6579 RepID=UPI001458DDA8|nr:uncharacterized protein LOC117344205 [Pecten maximus]